MRILALPRRIWKCLHPFTWLVMLVVGAGLVIIVVPGEMYTDWDKEQIGKNAWAHKSTMPTTKSPGLAAYVNDFYEHGWPLTAVVRTLHTIPTGSYMAIPTGPHWTKAINWPIEGDDWAINWVNLAINLAVAILLLIGIAVIAEVWIRRRGGRFRFRIFDLLGFASIVAMAFGWYQYHNRIQHRELADLAKHVSSLKGETMRFGYEIVGPTTNSPELEYCGPDWLVRLVGNEKYLPGLWHFRRVTITTLLPEFAKADIDQLARWPFLNHVTIRAGCPLYAIDKLAELRRLRSVTIEGLGGTTNTTPSRDFGEVGGFLCVDQLDKLAVLPVESLTLEGSKILAEDIACFLDTRPTIQRLTLHQAAITEEELENLRRLYPNYSIVAEWFDVRKSVFQASPPEWHELHVAEVKRQRAERLKQQSYAR